MQMKRSARLGISHVQVLVLAAVFSAMAYALEFVFHIKVGFLTFDAKDAVLTLGAMYLGPGVGAMMCILVALIEMVTVSTTGPWGFLMNAIGSGVFACVVSAIYRRRKTINRAVIGLCASVLSMTAAVLLLDLVIIPQYMTGVTPQVVFQMIPSLLLPFNVIKGLFNAGLVLLLYKPMSVALRRIHLTAFGGPSDRTTEAGNGKYFTKTTFVTLIAAILLIAVCIVIFLVFLNGNFELGSSFGS